MCGACAWCAAVSRQVCDEVAIMPSKRLRNKIAGYLTVRRAHTR